MARSARLPPALALACLALALPGASAQDAAPFIEAGRAVFAAHCAVCHGSDARGTINGPDLLALIGGMSEESFVGAVLGRYRWNLPVADAAGESSAQDALIRGVLARRVGNTEPSAGEAQDVIADGMKSLYRYLKAGLPAGR